MRLIKVKGKGHVTAEPDLVTLSFDINSTAEEYEECIQTLNKKADDLRNNITECGLDKTELKTSNFIVRVKEKEEEKQVFYQYYASHKMQIEFPLNKTLLNNILKHVAQGQSGAEIDIIFSVKDKDVLRNRALTNAVKIAKENAEILTSAAGMKLGKLMQIDYNWTDVHFYNPRLNEIRLYSIPRNSTNFIDPDIQPGAVGMSTEVALVYEIED